MKTLKLGKLYYEISRYNEPSITIKPGETIAIETEDAFSGQIRNKGDRRDEQAIPDSNPQSGPIYIEGVNSDDTLIVHINEIESPTASNANDVRPFIVAGELTYVPPLAAIQIICFI